jgi:hypothetical protein
MTNKFKVYAQTRATRQLAGDVANKILENKGTCPTFLEWREIEKLLNDIECKLENMELD